MKKGKKSYDLGSNGVELGTVNAGFEADEDARKAAEAAAAAGAAAQHLKEISVGEVQNPDEPTRQQWSSPMEFLMSCIAMSVGLGNIWRFPFTAYENGGGAFLIPYIVVLLVIGKPLYYLEMSLGQFTSFGCVKVWNMMPALKGMGYGQVYATVLVLTYYCSLMALTVFYLYSSFAAVLPWAQCDDAWTQGSECFDASGTGGNASSDAKSSSDLFFYNFVLNEPKDIDAGVGVPDWRLSVCLLLSWVTILLVIIRGVRSSGKAAYFLALFPYVVLFILLVRGATLPGAADGILFFITPKWERLLDPSVWYAAVSQAFFSLSVCFGTLIVYSSYNDFRHNVHRDAVIVTSLDTLTSLLAGCTIFSILGNLSHELGKNIEDVVKGGTGLAFVSYPDAIAKFDWVPQLFSVLFFLMLYTLGIGSAVALAGAVITIICDQFPSLRYVWVATGVCVFGFLVGLVYVTPGGQFVLNLVDFYAVTFTVFVMSCVEMMAVAWIYGVDNLCQDIEFMLGFRVSAYWRLCWGIVTPLLLVVILVYSLARLEPLDYQKVFYPTSAYAAGWTLLAIGLLSLPTGFIVQMIREERARRDAARMRGEDPEPMPMNPLTPAFWIHAGDLLRASFRPSPLWRPKGHKHFKEWQEFKAARARAAARLDEPRWKRVLRRITGLPSSAP